VTALTVWPAVDVRGGWQVGLIEGDLERMRTYGDAVAFARERARDGYEGLHVVDLDGASQGKPHALALVRAVRSAVPDLFVEVGGGVRRLEDVAAWLEAGADRVVVGTAAFAPTGEAPGDGVQGVRPLVAQCLERFGPERIAVAVDTRGDAVVLDAWRRSAQLTVTQAAERLGAVGIRYVVHTETSRDGSLAGARIDNAARLVAAGFQVAAAGGIASDADLMRLARAGVQHAVVGRAFHAGTWRPPVRMEVAS